MVRFFSGLLIAWLALVSITPAFGTDGKQLKKEFQALYDRQAEAARRRDVKALMEFNAPDHSVKLLDGSSISREQLERGMSNFFTSGQLVRQISFSYKVIEVRMQGEEAIVLVEQKDKRIQIRRDGQPHEVIANVIHRDTWRRTVEGWNRRLTEEVKQKKLTVDGKPVEYGKKG